MENKDWEKLLLKEIYQHFRGLLITNFGKDAAKMSFLQLDCLCEDIKSFIAQEKKNTNKQIIKELERILEATDNADYGWLEMEFDLNRLIKKLEEKI